MNVAISTAIEAAELMEIFQWVGEESVWDRIKDPKHFRRVFADGADINSGEVTLRALLDSLRAGQS